MSKTKTISVTTILTLILGFVAYYLFLPAMNIKSEGFWIFAMGIIGFVSILLAIFSKVLDSNFKKATKISFISLFVVMVIFFVIRVGGSVVFRAKSYSKLISNNITEHDFEDYKATIGNVPLLDKDSAMKIANRKLGGLQDVISQYEINDTEQITVRGEPARVACLNHAGFFKWISNRHNGTPGFIKVDMNTQEADLIRVDGGMKYTKSDYFTRNINRYLRMHYPTKMFWESTL